MKKSACPSLPARGCKWKMEWKGKSVGIDTYVDEIIGLK